MAKTGASWYGNIKHVVLSRNCPRTTEIKKQAKQSNKARLIRSLVKTLTDKSYLNQQLVDKKLASFCCPKKTLRTLQAQL